MGVLRELRRFSLAYVLMLTARSEETDKIVGLSTGADDYLTKSFSRRISDEGECHAAPPR